MLVLVREFTDEIGDRYWVQAQQRTYEVASLEKAEDHPEKLEADKVKIFECLTHDRSRFQNAVFFAICMFLMISLIANRILSTTFHSSEGGIARWVAVPVAGFVVGFGLTPFIMLAMKRWMPEPQTNAISAAWWPSMAGSLSLVLPVGVFRLILGAAGRYFPDYSCHGRWGIAFVPVAMGMCAAWIAPSCYAVGLGSVALVLAIGVTASMIVYSFGRAIDIADEFPLALMPVTIVLSLIFGAGAFMASPAVLIGVIGLAILIAIVHELLQRRAQQRLGTSDSELTLTASSDETPRTIEQLRIAIKGPKYHPPLAFQLVKKLIDPSITKPLQWIGLLGPAAAGKTAAAQHLIDEIQSLRPDLKVFSGRCTQDSPPYKPLREALAELGATAGIIVSGSPGGEVNTVFERLADEFIPFWDFISVDTDEEEGKETLRNEVLQGVLNVFRDLTQRQGVVLFLDDVQWIDEGSAALLKYLHENYAETSVHPLIIILAGREQPVLKNLGLDHVIVTLPPPSPTEQIRFLQTSFGIERQCAKHLVKALGVMSEEASNIFWLIRAVGELLSDNALIATPTGFQLSPSYARSGQLPIPEAMRAKLGASLRASGQYLPVLECAALLGQKFRVDDVAECLGMDRLLLLQILRHLEQELQLVRDVISDHECYAFSSEFMLEMVREELGVGTTHSPPSKIAKELHARIAAVLERRTPRTAQLIYDLAHHYFAAGTSYASKSVEYCLAAAEISRRHAELQTAQTYLKMAEKRASDDRRTLDHSQKRGMFGKGDPISAVSNKSAPETVPLPANSLTFDTPDVNHRLHGGDARISP